ncbi:MAG: hypothetical protein WKF70_14100 [Chitinophagaceae bacterium]
MTLDEFISLDHAEKQQIIHNKAEFLGNYYGLSIYIHLYRFNDFYIENCYNPGCENDQNISAAEDLLNLPCFVKIKDQGFGLN